jgi:hypothetical protein
MTIKIKIPGGSARFQEDKELAREIRHTRLLPALAENRSIRLDFSDVDYATQSFVHALIGEVLKRYGESILDRLEFHKCSQQLQNVISLVVNYSLGGFTEGIEEEVLRESATAP